MSQSRAAVGEAGGTRSSLPPADSKNRNRQGGSWAAEEMARGLRASGPALCPPPALPAPAPA